MRSYFLMLCALAMAGAAAADPTTVTGEKKRCCLSEKGPEPVPYTGKWLDGLYTRAECVAKKYGFWDGDTPNVAKKVCALRSTRPPPEDPVPPHDDTTKESTPAAPAGGRPNAQFYDQEKFTVSYDVKGSPESGSITEHVSDWGHKRVEIKDLTLSYAGIRQVTKQRVIYDRAEVVTVDLRTGAVTKIANPLYDKITASMRGKSGVEYGKEWATAMGASPTGKTGTYAGHSCDEWAIAQLGTTFCVTKGGITLYTATKMGPVSSTRTAKHVKIGDSGPAEAYAYDASKVQAVQNLQEIMKKARGGN